jgi:hypothetical protein
MSWKRALVVVFGWAMVDGCGAAQMPAQQAVPQMVPFASSGPLSAYSSSSSDEYSEVEFSGKAGKGLDVPHRGRGNDAVELIVRPDVLTTEFAIREVKPTFDEALAATKTTSAQVIAALAPLPGGAASLKLRGTSVARVMRKQQLVGVSVTVDGLLEVKIGNDLDFWGRSRLYAILLETTARLAATARSNEQPLRALRFEEVQPGVQNLEDHRPQLVERWIARARAFAALAEAKGAPLSLVDCAPPGAVTAARVSLEEAALQLAITCRVDTRGHEAAADRR